MEWELAQILARKVEDKIPEINVTSVLPANSAHMIDEDQYDLVITTISKLKIPHPYVAYTTPIVSQQDVPPDSEKMPSDERDKEKS